MANKTLCLFGAAALLVATACGQDYNSNSGDEVYAKAPSTASCDTPVAARTCSAIAIMRPLCYSCHADMIDFDTDAKWINSGRVSPGNPDGSTIITKLINAGGNMPSGGSALPAADYETLRAWVTQMPAGN